MNLTHIEHLGIAVKNLDESIKFYEEIFGLKCYAIEEVADQKVKTAFFPPASIDPSGTHRTRYPARRTETRRPEPRLQTPVRPQPGRSRPSRQGLARDRFA